MSGKGDFPIRFNGLKDALKENGTSTFQSCGVVRAKVLSASVWLGWRDRFCVEKKCHLDSNSSRNPFNAKKSFKYKLNNFLFENNPSHPFPESLYADGICSSSIIIVTNAHTLFTARQFMTPHWLLGIREALTLLARMHINQQATLAATPQKCVVFLLLGKTVRGNVLKFPKQINKAHKVELGGWLDAKLDATPGAVSFNCLFGQVFRTHLIGITF